MRPEDGQRAKGLTCAKRLVHERFCEPGHRRSVLGLLSIGGQPGLKLPSSCMLWW